MEWPSRLTLSSPSASVALRMSMARRWILYPCSGLSDSPCPRMSKAMMRRRAESPSIWASNCTAVCDQPGIITSGAPVPCST